MRRTEISRHATHSSKVKFPMAVCVDGFVPWIASGWWINSRPFAMGPRVKPEDDGEAGTCIVGEERCRSNLARSHRFQIIPPTYPTPANLVYSIPVLSTGNCFRSRSKRGEDRRLRWRVTDPLSGEVASKGSPAGTRTGACWTSTVRGGGSGKGYEPGRCRRDAERMR